MSKTTETLQEFKPLAAEWFKKADFLRKYYTFFNEFFKRENLEKAEWPDIQKVGDHLHCFQTMALAKANAISKPKHPIEHYRKSFHYLAHGPGEPAERIRQFRTNPEFKLESFGKSAISELVGYLFPNDFMFVNSRVEFAVQYLGIKVDNLSSGNLVTRLKAFNDATRPVAKEYLEIVGKQTDLPLNFEVDQFFSWIYETYSDFGGIGGRRYWTLSAGSGGELWDQFFNEEYAALNETSVSDLRNFKSKNEILQAIKVVKTDGPEPTNDAHACWQFANVLKPGDIIFAKAGRSKLLGYGEVTGEYSYDAARPSFQHLRTVQWKAKGEWLLSEENMMAMKTLTDITPYPDFVQLISKTVGLRLEDVEPKIVEPKPTQVNYWWLNVNPQMWDIRKAPIGSLQTYTSRNEAGNKRQKYKHFQAVKPGDLLFGYVTNPDKEIVAVCEITKGLHDSPPDGEIIEFKKIKDFKVPVSLAELQTVKELSLCEPVLKNQGSLFTVTSDEYEIIRLMLDDLNPANKPPLQKFSKADALNGLFMNESDLDKIMLRLKRKKAVILQGPPGVGKTFVARRLAYLQMGVKDSRRVTMVQFHPSYGYEDFVQGYRPTRTSLELRNGVFHEFARLARNDPEQDWFFVIDEINRGNLAKIFGELLMLIEADKRGPDYAIPLTYSETADETFYLPPNLYIIGTMNTADRSLAMVDYALRRRFAFVTLNPALDSSEFGTWLVGKGASTELVARIRKRVAALNAEIEKERDLGSGFRIGHSFFCPNEGPADDAWYEEIVDSEIKPLLEEYFESSERVEQLIKDLLA